MKQKKFIFVGTLHSGATPHKELIDALREYQPDKLFIELSPEELTDDRRKESIRDKMFAAYDWAQENSIDTFAFDEENDVLKEGVTGSEPIFKQMNDEGKKLLQQYSWKELNEDEPWMIHGLQDLEDHLNANYIDTNKSEERDARMLRRIRENIVAGTNVVLTGAGHLHFFEKNIPHASFPYRNKNGAQ